MSYWELRIHHPSLPLVHCQPGVPVVFVGKCLLHWNACVANNSHANQNVRMLLPVASTELFLGLLPTVTQITSLDLRVTTLWTHIDIYLIHSMCISHMDIQVEEIGLSVPHALFGLSETHFLPQMGHIEGLDLLRQIKHILSLFTYLCVIKITYTINLIYI